MTNFGKPLRITTMAGVAIALFGIGGCCKDIVYAWDIPETEADCPVNTKFVSAPSYSVDHDGGPGIIDRDSGTGIIDRDEEFVTAYCLQVCPDDKYDGKPVLDIHNKHEMVEAKRRCPEEEEDK